MNFTDGLPPLSLLSLKSQGDSQGGPRRGHKTFAAPVKRHKASAKNDMVYGSNVIMRLDFLPSPPPNFKET